jgi:hypothetical protein
MEKVAQQICDKIVDYHNGKVKFDVKHVIKWVSQFDKGDQQFILEEFLHLINQGIYISQSDAREIMIKQLLAIAKHVKLEPIKFFENVDFLSMQGEQKSQSILLKILDEELVKKFGIKLKNCGKVSKKYAIYIDDVLCTGHTFFEDVTEWLRVKNSDGLTNLDKVLSDEKICIGSFLCKHSWSVENIKYQFKKAFQNALMQKIKFQSYYVIENHPSTPEQRLNFAYPVKDNQPKEVLEYFDSLDNLYDVMYKGEFAFRKKDTPKTETFFSSPANRIRFENILLNKGIELLSKVGTLQKNQRPLGMTNPTKKILGTGTLFFTWNNVSNTSPVVFWWEITGSKWYPLFKLEHRGLN